LIFRFQHTGLRERPYYGNLDFGKGMKISRLDSSASAMRSGALRRTEAVMAAINEREERLREITNQVIEPGLESLQEKLEELRTFAVLRLTLSRELLTNPEARALLADQIGKFKLERVNQNGRTSFKANGNIDFFWEEVLTRLGGAPDHTMRVYHFGLSLAA
jgi:hypothetical protein